MARRVYFVVHGTVQGVGFRYFTRCKAREYDITGWCRNTPDNTVEGEAQSDGDSLSRFLADVKEGPRYARVERVTLEDRELIDDERGFDVRH
ncbi:hypothetical protein E4U41_005117 [Claviceps citrina]|nr:hypothetical protein E4U41_005117 [Claviceps citrina]